MSLYHTSENLANGAGRTHPNSMTWRGLARKYNAFGINIVPLGADKRPALTGVGTNGAPRRFEWQAWQDERQAGRLFDAILAPSWWTDVRGVAALGGPVSGDLLTFDGDQADIEVARAQLHLLGLPADYEWFNPSGSGSGWHLYVRCPGWRQEKAAEKRQAVGGGVIECRWRGSYTAMPGSWHPSGNVYPGTPVGAPASVTVEQATAFRDAIACEAETPSAAARPAPTRPAKAPTGDGLRAYVDRALAAEAAAVASAHNGDRNSRLNRASFALGTLVGASALDRSAAEAALTDAALAAGLTDGEIRATMRSGLDAGVAQPRDLSGVARVRTPAVEQNSDGGHEPGDMLISDRIDRDLQRWGYSLWLNDMDESVWNGEERMNDADRAVLRMTARDAGYAQARLMSALDDAIVALATRRRRHPVRDYLAGLTWDGSDHIAHLASYFDDRHEPIAYSDGSRRTVFHAFLRRWLVSAIAKMHGDESAARSNFVLVLAGEQNAGKSHFAGWLCPLRGYFVEKHIAPEDRDCSLQRTRAWVWEVMELGATTGRANVEALKGHITATHVTERKAYGHFDTVRPAVASYIGTVNPDGGGFLADQTGNRRFAVVDVDHINWQYSERVDVDQVWAQAMQLWRADPEGYRFAAEERAVQAGNAEAHMAPDIFADMLVRTYQIDPAQTDWRATSSEILENLRTYAGLSRGHDGAAGRQLARTLKTHWGIVGKRSSGATIYTGLARRILSNLL